MSAIEIRRADPSWSDRLTALAHVSKRHWGYPETWIAAWRDELTLTPELIEAHHVWIALRHDDLLGCCALVLDPKPSIEHMWIDPAAIGHGVGRRLFDHATERARTLGATELEIISDPNAAGFYRRLGAVPAGEYRTEILGQPRTLPIFRYPLARPEDPG